MAGVAMNPTSIVPGSPGTRGEPPVGSWQAARYRNFLLRYCHSDTGQRETQLGVAMTPQSAPAGRAGPAGRGPQVRAAVLAPTLAELTENGYAALTVDNVARRSGVHKTTIYRRWKDREGLVADA